jgi:hypothetical protein
VSIFLCVGKVLCGGKRAYLGRRRERFCWGFVVFSLSRGDATTAAANTIAERPNTVIYLRELHLAALRKDNLGWWRSGLWWRWH